MLNFDLNREMVKYSYTTIKKLTNLNFDRKLRTVVPYETKTRHFVFAFECENAIFFIVFILTCRLSVSMVWFLK